MNSSELVASIKESFLNQFPKGFISVIEGSGFYKDTITIYLGLIADRNDCPNKIRDNDPMMHSLLFFKENDGTYSSSDISGALKVNPKEPRFAMDHVKTKYRKLNGDAPKISKGMDNWFRKLKSIVDENKANIYGADKIQGYL